MPQIGPLEILTVAIIALVVFGPEKMPEIARNAGRWMAELRRIAADVREEFQSSLDVADEPEDEAPNKVSPTDHPVARAMRAAQAEADAKVGSERARDGEDPPGDDDPGPAATTPNEVPSAADETPTDKPNETK